MVVQLLDWDLSAVTPVDLVDQLLSRLTDVISDAAQRSAVKRHAVTFIAMCTTRQSSSLSVCLSLCIHQAYRTLRHANPVHSPYLQCAVQRN